MGMIEYFLIRYSKLHSYNYDNITMVIVVELSKLLVCILIYGLTTHRFLLLDMTSRNNLKHGIFYLVPAFVYACYNNFTYYNLANVDPSTFQIIMQSRLVITALLLYIFCRKIIIIEKWLALILLIIGIIIKNYQYVHLNDFSVLTSIFFQASLSSIASVYNEQLYKSDIRTSIYLQNGYLYLFGTIFNMLFSLVSYKQLTINAVRVSNSEWNTITIGIILCNIFVGLSASFIIKYLDSLVKNIYSTLEISLTAILTVIIFKINYNWIDILSCLIVSMSILLYSFSSKQTFRIYNSVPDILKSKKYPECIEV